MIWLGSTIAVAPVSSTTYDSLEFRNGVSVMTSTSKLPRAAILTSSVNKTSAKCSHHILSSEYADGTKMVTLPTRYALRAGHISSGLCETCSRLPVRNCLSCPLIICALSGPVIGSAQFELLSKSITELAEIARAFIPMA